MRCENGDYAADGDIAQAVPRAPTFPETLVSPEEVVTPGVTTCEALGDFLGIDVAATSKAMPVTKPDGTVVLALVRGDDRLSEMKLYDAIPGDTRPATDDEIRAAFGASGGSLGPVGFAGEVIADETLRTGQFVAGANKDGVHLRGVEAGRDYEPRFADLREPKEGDRCPNCGGALHFQTAVEVGHIFNFGSFYSKPLDATFLDEDGQEKPLLGGSYGIGPARVMAAIVEQHNDDDGIVWPPSVAPYDVHLVALPGADEIAAAGGGRVVRRGLRRPPRRPRSARGGEVRGCRPHRLPGARDGGEEEPGRWEGRRPRPSHRRGATVSHRRPWQGRHVMARKKRFSEQPFGETVETLMNDVGVTYRELATRTGLSAGYLNHLVHGNRPVPSNEVVKTLSDALGVEPEHFREYRLRAITERLEAMPELIDRLYRRPRLKVLRTFNR